MELIQQFKKIIPSIEGDRIGIVIFNTAPIVYCPLTEDYSYINECLEKIEKQLDLVVKNNGNIPYDVTSEEELEIFLFWYGGVVANSDVNLYAYCPTVEMNSYTSKEKIASYKSAVEQKAGGKFYTGNLEKMTKSMVQEIKETKTSLLKTSKKRYVTDHPQIIFISIMILFFSLIVLEKRIRL